MACDPSITLQEVVEILDKPSSTDELIDEIRGG
jgi:hypothetical protein